MEKKKAWDNLPATVLLYDTDRIGNDGWMIFRFVIVMSSIYHINIIEITSHLTSDFTRSLFIL
jgi:hypothetical protein